MESVRWVSAEEDVTEGDLGLGKIPQLDICTGTAEDKLPGNNVNAHEGAARPLNKGFGLLPPWSCNALLIIPESSVDDHLTMEDLISYSFQVAKGMEFLSSRKVK